MITEEQLSLHRAISKNSDKKIVIWGTGDAAIKTIINLGPLFLFVDFFIDGLITNEAFFYGKRVIPKEKLETDILDNTIIIIASSSHNEIKKFLVEDLKLDNNVIYNHIPLKESLSQKFNILFEGDCIINGNPIIDSRNGGKIIIGNNVTLNSENYGYHLNMHSPVKLFVDREGAIISIGENSRIHGTCIHATKRILIGKNCLIAANTQIIDSNGHTTSMQEPWMRIHQRDIGKEIIIEDNVWIGANSVILPGVRIGTGSIIGAGSVVKSDIPANSLALGNPAKIFER